ncbi:uncharacterized protein [Pempheris klunzingeri]|uniref:uncharacterized protein n=1 Tax=Pempheris klunzingeri TaxID=3127111 RepID=UPI003980AC97
MAQSNSCPNPDLSNGAVVHSPLAVCSFLNTQRGREVEDGEGEDEEVELAEEVGEDVLIMAQKGEGQVEEESRELSEREDMKVIRMALLTNGVIAEEQGEGKTMKENGEQAIKVGDEENKMTDEWTRENRNAGKGETESKDTKAATSVLLEVGTGHILDRNEEGTEGEEESMTSSSETRISVTKSNDEDNEEHKLVPLNDDAENVQDSSTVLEESGEDAQLDPTINVATVTMGINVINQHDACQTSAVGDNSICCDSICTNKVVTDLTKQLTSETKEEMKNIEERDNSESSKQDIESINNNRWLQEDCREARVEQEGTKNFVKDAMFDCDYILDRERESKANQKVEVGLACASSEEQTETERGIEEIGMVVINQTNMEEEQMRRVWVDNAVMDGGEPCMEDEGKTGDNGVREHIGRGDLEMYEEKIVLVENWTEIDLPGPVLQCVEDVPLGTQQDVDLDQVEEAFELEEGGEVEPHETGDEIKPTKERGGDLQEHPLQLREQAGTDWVESLRQQLREQALAEEEKGGAEEEAMEMAEEPVTVLDDDIEEIKVCPSTDLEEQKPATITAPSEDTIVETNDGKYQELQEQKVELGKENEEKQKREEGEVGNDEKPKNDSREVKGVKELTQAMENEILSPEPQLFSKEKRGSVKVLSPKREDNDWIKKDQPEEAREWRKELRPVKKDIRESEWGRKEWVKNETLPIKEKSPPRKEDWLKELKSVIKDESLPKKVKKKRVVLLEDGHSYVPQHEEMREVKLISYRQVENPFPPLHRNNTTPQDQDYEISLYVKCVLKLMYVSS